MTGVGVRELRNRLSYYLSRVREGEEITVTSRGRAIALLTPPEQLEIRHKILEMVSDGIAHWEGGKPEGSLRRVTVRGKSLSEIVIEDRG